MPNSRTFKLDTSKSQQLKVVVRIRPLFEHEQEKGATKIARKADHKMVLLSDPTSGDPVDVLRAKRSQERKYVFDWAFDEDSTQEEVYEKTTKQLVANVVDGYNGTVFAYGATGSGKTYTMVGEENHPGIMVRALKDLFLEVEADTHKLYDLSMSYLEIYNENIRDLLNPSPLQLELREDAKGNHQVAGLSHVKVASSEQVMSLLTRGNKHRTQEATGANLTSSRSHAVLVVRVKKKTPASSKNQQLKTGHLYMVDLAGSERAAQTQNTGKRLLEGAHINKSLLALGNCINALAERNARYVNFRDSKLTRILKEPLSGNCRTVMVSHISPSHYHFEESRNTLAYADRAKNITTKLKSNVSDVSHHVAQYQAIINELRQEIQTLHRRIEHSNPDEFKGEDKKLTDKEMKELKKQLIESFNAQMNVRRRIMEVDNVLLAQSIDFDKLGMIISEWETEKAVSSLENQSDSNKEKMPEHVMQAWDDLQLVKHQHHKYLEMRNDCSQEYQECKNCTLAVTESLSEKEASSQEQKELLHLLTRVYELEIEKLEMQSAQLSREHELRCRDLMLLRYDRQRQLCDDIITRQRILIDALATGEESENVNARRELNELYLIYQQEIQELSNGRNSENTSSPVSSVFGPLGSMQELHQLNTSRNNPLPPITQSEKNERRLFLRRRPFRRGSDGSSNGVQLPPLSIINGSEIRNSNSSSNSSCSTNDRGSISMYSPLSYTNDRSSNSSEQKFGRMEEERKRYGILPSLRKGASSDSEICIKPIERVGSFKNMEGRKHQIAEERRSKLWGDSGKAVGY